MKIFVLLLCLPLSALAVLPPLRTVNVGSGYPAHITNVQRVLDVVEVSATVPSAYGELSGAYLITTNCAHPTLTVSFNRFAGGTYSSTYKLFDKWEEIDSESQWEELPAKFQSPSEVLQQQYDTACATPEF